MIHVDPAPEPSDFDSKVRQPGLSAIAELVGEGQLRIRRGPKREPVASTREEIPATCFHPFWRDAAEDILAAYGRICAYACLYIERITGHASTDHMVPRSLQWDRVYEWENYRLACGLMNSRKGAFGDVLDPFQVEEGMFAIDFVSLKAIPGPRVGDRRAEVEATIARLGLDGADYSAALGDYYHLYMAGQISLEFLQRRAPFLASEMVRQRRLRRIEFPAQWRLAADPL